jgi:hypothetical protein
MYHLLAMVLLRPLKLRELGPGACRFGLLTFQTCYQPVESRKQVVDHLRDRVFRISRLWCSV